MTALGHFDKSLQRWVEMPRIDRCWRGDHQRAFPEGKVYSNQLFCARYGTWINPNGFTCRLCREGRWPRGETWAARELPEVLRTQGGVAAREAILAAAQGRRLSYGEAVAAGRTYLGEDMSEALRGALSAPLRRGTRDLTDGSRVVQAPLLDACAHRGEVITQREAPCCGGKFRREELYRCNHPRNEAQEAWSVVCRHCVLEKAT